VQKIIYVNMDAFDASVEQRDDPQLRGKPVIVAWRSKSSVVCAASYEALKIRSITGEPSHIGRQELFERERPCKSFFGTKTCARLLNFMPSRCPRTG